MNVMTYKGYAARIEYSDEDACFIGRLEGMRDGIGFQGDTVDGLRAAFREAVEDYLETCRKLGRPAQGACAGNFTRETEAGHQGSLRVVQRDAGLRLASLGGTDPEAKSAPRRKSVNSPPPVAAFSALPPRAPTWACR